MLKILATLVLAMSAIGWGPGPAASGRRGAVECLTTTTVAPRPGASGVPGSVEAVEFDAAVGARTVITDAVLYTNDCGEPVRVQLVREPVAWTDRHLSVDMWFSTSSGSATEAGTVADSIVLQPHESTSVSLAVVANDEGAQRTVRWMVEVDRRPVSTE